MTCKLCVDPFDIEVFVASPVPALQIGRVPLGRKGHRMGIRITQHGRGRRQRRRSGCHHRDTGAIRHADQKIVDALTPHEHEGDESGLPGAI